ncbi:MAG: carbohydrate ABC transporter permease [Actinomycetales bacterium]|nr:carbohydrate ABC transporter permease [Actinomycetales bacterium]
MTTDVKTPDDTTDAVPAGRSSRAHTALRRVGWNTRQRPNLLAGLLALAWAFVIAVPLYYIIQSSLVTRSDYLSKTFLAWPTRPTLKNYQTALDSGFNRYLLNTAVVTVFTVAIVLVLAIPAAYAISRSRSRFVGRGFSMMLLGLAIPAQAVIVPLYLIITRIDQYDKLTGIILPTAAFSLPVAVLVLTSSLRDIPRELYEAMTLDGATVTRLLFTLVLPMSRSSITTVGVYTAIGAWNGLLFPLILTQSDSQRVLTLGLWKFQGQFGTDFPALLAAVVLSGLPILLLYLFGRRQLISGVTAGAGK